jgi:hypothetical protein
MLALLLALLVHAAGASEPAPDSPSSLLAGPRVVALDAAPTLAHFGADGRLLPLEDREEIVAVDLLGLTSDERKPIDDFVRLRTADVMSGGLGKIPILLELQEAVASADPAKVDAVLARYAENRTIWAGKTPVDDAIASLLPERTRAEYRRFVREYQDAWISERSRAMAAPADREKLLIQLEREKRLADIRRPTEARLAEARARFERISTRLELSPEQQGRIQTLLQEYAAGTKFNPKPRDGLKLLYDLSGVLTWHQRAAMLKFLREEKPPSARFRPWRDAPMGTSLGAGTPMLLFAARRKRRSRLARAGA